MSSYVVICHPCLHVDDKHMSLHMYALIQGAPCRRVDNGSASCLPAPANASTPQLRGDAGVDTDHWVNSWWLRAGSTLLTADDSIL